MRDIKFRGKILENFGNNIGEVIFKKEKWIYGGITYDIDRAWIDTSYYGQIAVIPETIGQYTGLKDKNEKEIYEGDIVYIVLEDERAIIRWDDEIARYVVIYDNIITDFDNWYGKDLEVIGNIYDNPELLEEGE